MASSGVILNAVPVSNHTSVNTSAFTAVTAHPPDKSLTSAGTSSVTAAAGALFSRGVSSASAALPSPSYKARVMQNLQIELSCPRPSQNSQGAENKASVASEGSSSDTAHSASCSSIISEFTMEDKAKESAKIGYKHLGIGDPFSWDLSNFAFSEQVAMPLSKCLTAVCTGMANMAGNSCTCCVLITAPISVRNENTRYEGNLSLPLESRKGIAGDSSHIESDVLSHQKCPKDAKEEVEVGDKYEEQLHSYLPVVVDSVKRTDWLNVVVPCQSSHVEEEVCSSENYPETLLMKGTTVSSGDGDSLAEKSALKLCKDSKKSFDLIHCADDFDNSDEEGCCSSEPDRECDGDDSDDSILFSSSGNVVAANCIVDDNDSKSEDCETVDSNSDDSDEVGESDDCETDHCNSDDSDAIESCKSEDCGTDKKLISNNGSFYRSQKSKNYNSDSDSSSDTDSDSDTDRNSDTGKDFDSDSSTDSGSYSSSHKDTESNPEFSEDSDDDGIQFGNFDDMDSDDDLSLQISLIACASLPSAPPVTKKTKISKLADDVVDSKKTHISRAAREDLPTLTGEALFEDVFNEDDNVETFIRKANSRWLRYYPKPDVIIESEIEVVFEHLLHVGSSRPLRADSKPLKSSLKLGSYCGIDWSHSCFRTTTSLESIPDIHVDRRLTSVRVVQSHDRITNVCFEESLTIFTNGFSSQWSKREENAVLDSDEIDERFCADEAPHTPKLVPTCGNDLPSCLEDLFFSSSMPLSSSLTASNYHQSRNVVQTPPTASDLELKSVPQPTKVHSGTSLGPLKCASLSSELNSDEFQAASTRARLEEGLALVECDSELDMVEPNHQHQSQLSFSPSIPAYCGQTGQQATTQSQIQSFSTRCKTPKEASMIHTKGEGGRTLKHRVTLNLLVKTRVLRTWRFAHSKARNGSYWMQCARDRLRFKTRLETVARTVEPVLTKEHRKMVWARMKGE